MARKRMHKLNALVGTIVVTMMLILYFLAVPTFTTTTIGKVFSVAWLILALITLGGFGIKVIKRKQKKRFLAPVCVAETLSLSDWQKRKQQKISSL